MDNLINTPEEAKAIVDARNARISKELRKQCENRRRLEQRRDELALEKSHKEVWE